MYRRLTSFLRDEAGLVTSPEWALVATILVLGAITCLVAARSASSLDSEPPPAVQGR
jgi:hypothetical protein